jgi:PAS domain-containing protein
MSYTDSLKIDSLINNTNIAAGIMKSSPEHVPNPAETLKNVLDIISDGVWDWNVVTGHVSRNAGWYRMLEHDVNSLNKDVLTWENVIHPDDYPHVMSHFEDYIQGRDRKSVV